MTLFTFRATAPLDVCDAGTPAAPHVRDAMNVQRLMNCVVLALLPAFFAVLHEAGRQANLAVAQLDAATDAGWRVDLLDRIRVGHDPTSWLAAVAHGLLMLLPLYLVALLAGGFWQRLFARSRGAVAPGLTVTTLLFTLGFPPSIAVWQVALGVTFGVVVGREIFGGAGKNFVHPVLAGLAFLYFAYPDAFRDAPIQAPAFACVIGAAVLLYARAISWRVLAGGFLGVAVGALSFQHFSAENAAFTAEPWYWHLSAGGFAFGLVFFASDPVTAATTNPGRWLYGLLIGLLSVLIRVANPKTQAVMLAILLGNVIAPLIDYGVIWANVRRRLWRSGHDER